MSRLSKKIRQVTKVSNRVPGVVRSVIGNKATVQLSGNGPLLHNITVIGSSTSVKDIVEVDFSSPTPVCMSAGVKEVVKNKTVAVPLRGQTVPISRSTFVPAMLGYIPDTATNIYPSYTSGSTGGLGATVALPTGITSWAQGIFITPPDFTGEITVYGIAFKTAGTAGSVTTVTSINRVAVGMQENTSWTFEEVEEPTPQTIDMPSDAGVYSIAPVSYTVTASSVINLNFRRDTGGGELADNLYFAGWWVLYS